MTLSTYEYAVIYFYIKIKLEINYMIGYTRLHLTLINIARVHEVFMTKSFLDKAAPLKKEGALGKGS